jgi:hypothetical protein
MKPYTQQVLSAPAKLPVMLKDKKGKDTKIQATYRTKSGQVKKKYVKNPNAHQIKAIKHVAVTNHDVKVEA